MSTQDWEAAGEDTLTPLRDMLEPEAFRDIVVLYESTMRKAVEAIEDSARRGDLVAIGRNAHDLAGLCGQLGSGRATALARRLENSCNNGDREGIPSMANELRLAVGEALATLAELAR